MRKNNYVVGYRTQGNVVYGKEKEGTWAMPLTLAGANKLKKSMKSVNGRYITRPIIYKLVEVK